VKKWVLLPVVVLAVLTISCSMMIAQLGGAFSKAPSDLASQLSPAARELVSRAYDGIEPTRLTDYHAHVVGLGAGGTGCSVNPRMRSWAHPLERLKFEVYLSAAGIRDIEQADRQYVSRLVELVRRTPHPAKVHIVAFDKYYDTEGLPNLERTEFHTPNAYVMDLAGEFPDVFVPVISVHPYRQDAVEALERWAQRGARFVKWLPNAMGIDPSRASIEPYYEKMSALGMVLLTHAGDEKAVHAEEAQRLGNPLLLRRPLDAGVKVIVAHCASLGDNEDLDDPVRPRISNFRLFMRLMEDERYEGLLFADISATTQANRLFEPLAELLKRQDLHARLVNGSDYPLPGINILVRTGVLARAGYISKEQRRALNEIYDYNPLLFDFVLKRTVRLPESGRGFAASVFMSNPGLH